MKYKVLKVMILNDGSLEFGRRPQVYISFQILEIGGLYFLRKGNLYKVLGEV